MHRLPIQVFANYPGSGNAETGTEIGCSSSAGIAWLEDMTYITSTWKRVMIGDRIDNDIVPAKQLGMKTIWIKQGFGSLWTVMDESEKADIEVNNLSDILNYL